jgi:hypothetical protein
MRVRVYPCRRQALVVLILVLAACGRKTSEIPVIPPATPPLSRPVIGYGVVNVSYTHVLEEPGEGGVSIGYLRRGSLIRVLERRAIIIGAGAESWVLAEEFSPQGPKGPQGSPQGSYQGWIRENVVDIYDNEFQANTAVGSMTR